MWDGAGTTKADFSFLQFCFVENSAFTSHEKIAFTYEVSFVELVCSMIPGCESLYHWPCIEVSRFYLESLGDCGESWWKCWQKHLLSLLAGHLCVLVFTTVNLPCLSEVKGSLSSGAKMFMTQEEVIIRSILGCSHLKRLLKRKVVLQMPASIKMLNTSCSFPTAARGNASNMTSHLFPFIRAQDACLLQRTPRWHRIAVWWWIKRHQQQQSFIYQETTLSKDIPGRGPLSHESWPRCWGLSQAEIKHERGYARGLETLTFPAWSNVYVNPAEDVGAESNGWRSVMT